MHLSTTKLISQSRESTSSFYFNDYITIRAMHVNKKIFPEVNFITLYSTQNNGLGLCTHVIVILYCSLLRHYGDGV